MITSTQNATIKDVKKLLMKKYRQKEGRMLIEGKNLLDAAKAHNLLESSFHLEPHPDYPKGTVLSDHVMRHLTKTKTPPRDAGVAKIPASQTAGKRVLILENVQDPGNVGTLLRSALAFGFDTVVFDESADPYAQKVMRSTQGAIFSLNILFDTVPGFKSAYPGHTLVGAHLDRDAKTYELPADPLALVLGNEGHGLKDSTIRSLDRTVYVQIQNIDSLNVAIAGSIIMHAFSGEKPLFG